jgi:hypothetical protein
MIGGLSTRALSDGSTRDLSSAWGGAGLIVPSTRRLQLGGHAVMRPARERTAQ